MTDSGAPSPPKTQADLYIGAVKRLAAVLGKHIDEIGQFEAVTLDELPHDYRTLLAHTGHMTVTLEAFHSSLVDVHAIETVRDPSSYARCSLLTRQSDGRVVQYGVVRIWLESLPPEAREEIKAEQTPLGRVLIRHGVLRDVELINFWRVRPSDSLRHHFGIADEMSVYGRSAQILVAGRPTIQLLEIVNLSD